MKIGLAILLVLHGAIHVAGFLKAFGLAELPRLGHAISRTLGILWLLAGMAFVVSAVLLFVDGRHWWIAATPAVVLSQVLIAGGYHNAKFGTIANAIVLIPLIVSLADLRPMSLRAQYHADVRIETARISRLGDVPPVTESDLAPLPTVVQTYLRRAGVVGKPHVRSLHATFRARMRTSADARWMTATVEQYNFFEPGAPARLFFMEASRLGVPFVAYHRYVGDAATMRVRIAGLFTVVDAHGPQMTQGETVTLFNDMCFLAPAALVDAPVRWNVVDDRMVAATYTNAGKTISAQLTFDAAGDLVGFVSRDRYQSDGRTYRQFPWSTPLGDFRDFAGARLPSYGEAHWHEPAGEWTYGQFWLERIAYNESATAR
jgi:hypothetical protein